MNEQRYLQPSNHTNGDANRLIEYTGRYLLLGLSGFIPVGLMLNKQGESLMLDVVNQYSWMYLRSKEECYRECKRCCVVVAVMVFSFLDMVVRHDVHSRTAREACRLF